jgi:hypothetical protein
VQDVSGRDAAVLARDPDIGAVAMRMPSALMETLDIGTGPAAGNAWEFPALKADTSPFDGDGVVVAALDTGIDKTHPALRRQHRRRLKRNFQSNEIKSSGAGDAAD